MRFILILLIGLVTACSSHLNQPLPNKEIASQTFKLEQLAPEKQLSLLTIQYEPTQWRWIQTDALGAPLARLQLSQQGWQNDGFIMPNRQAQQLFAVLANALHPEQPIFNQIKGSWKQQDQKIYIQLDDNSQWIFQEVK